MKRVTLVLMLCAMLGIIFGCSNKKDAVKALYNAGYTKITPGGYSWFSCGEGDFYSTKFTATNPAGKRASGTVCSGLLFKGSTIRF